MILPPKLNPPPISPIARPPGCLPKTLFTVRVHTTQSTCKNHLNLSIIRFSVYVFYFIIVFISYNYLASKLFIMTNNDTDIDQVLENLDPSLSPLNSISSDILEAALPTILNPLHPNLNQAIINNSWKNTFSFSYSTYSVCKCTEKSSFCNASDSFQVTINNDVVPPKKRYDMMQDPIFINSGLMPPTPQPLKSPSKLTNVSDKNVHTHPECKPNLTTLFMTSTDYTF